MIKNNSSRETAHSYWATCYSICCGINHGDSSRVFVCYINVTICRVIGKKTWVSSYWYCTTHNHICRGINRRYCVTTAVCYIDHTVCRVKGYTPRLWADRNGRNYCIGRDGDDRHGVGYIIADVGVGSVRRERYPKWTWGNRNGRNHGIGCGVDDRDGLGNVARQQYQCCHWHQCPASSRAGCSGVARGSPGNQRSPLGKGGCPRATAVPGSGTCGRRGCRRRLRQCTLAGRIHRR